ncbi:hypothetical protein [Peptoclostridium litorale]|uniref:hypothetical protein n=1 Tax=Peptoclostridium litorale TaxID=1557 RepID=UPI000AF36FA5|nr:hypothetical protein [Peptoclostridium litorale]
MRTESERYNARWKNLDLEKPSVRNINSISNLNTIGHICVLSTALGAVKNAKDESCVKFTKSLQNL